MRYGENRGSVVFIEMVTQWVNLSRASALGLEQSMKGTAGPEVNGR